MKENRKALKNRIAALEEDLYNLSGFLMGLEPMVLDINVPGKYKIQPWNNRLLITRIC